jgi:hypothetical protein
MLWFMRHLLALFLVACSSPAPTFVPSPAPATAGSAGALVTGGGGSDAGGAAGAVTVMPGSGGTVTSGGGAGGTAAGGLGGDASAGQVSAAGAAGGGVGGQGGDAAVAGAGSSAGGMAAGGMAAGGMSVGGGGTGGKPPVEPAPAKCSLPTDGPGSVCGSACGFTSATRPAGYGYPTANDGVCSCSPREVGTGRWIDLRGQSDICTPTNLTDSWVRAQYTLDGQQCARIWADWNGWSMRVFTPGSTETPLFAGCALVRGVDAVGNLPPVRVEVFGSGDGWVRTEAVECDFGTKPVACD